MLVTLNLEQFRLEDSYHFEALTCRCTLNFHIFHEFSAVAIHAATFQHDSARNDVI